MHRRIEAKYKKQIKRHEEEITGKETLVPVKQLVFLPLFFLFIYLNLIFRKAWRRWSFFCLSFDSHFGYGVEGSSKSSCTTHASKWAGPAPSFRPSLSLAQGALFSPFSKIFAIFGYQKNNNNNKRETKRLKTSSSCIAYGVLDSNSLFKKNYKISF